MTTARVLIEQSLRLIGVTASGEPPTAEEINDGLDTLNQMVSGLEAEGVHLNFAPISLDSEVPVEDRFIESIKYLLAVRLSSEYGSELTPEIPIIALNGKAFLQTWFSEIPTLKMDRGLRNRTSRFGDRNGFDG